MRLEQPLGSVRACIVQIFYLGVDVLEYVYCKPAVIVGVCYFVIIVFI